MQKLSACRNRDWLTHFFFSTSSVCMIAIWPVGPPNEINPSFNQNLNASPKVGVGHRSCLMVAFCQLIAAAGTSKVRRSIQIHGAGFLRQEAPLSRNLSGCD